MALADLNLREVIELEVVVLVGVLNDMLLLRITLVAALIALVLFLLSQLLVA